MKHSEVGNSALTSAEADHNQIELAEKPREQIQVNDQADEMDFDTRPGRNENENLEIFTGEPPGGSNSN